MSHLPSVESAGLVEVVEDELVDGGDPSAVGVGEPDDFVDFAAGDGCSAVVGGIAGHLDGDAVGVAVGLGVEGAQVGGGGGDDGDGELFVDFSGEGVEVGLAGFAFAAGDVGCGVSAWITRGGGTSRCWTARRGPRGARYRQVPRPAAVV
jgi:hypothetical protein